MLAIWCCNLVLLAEHCCCVCVTDTTLHDFSSEVVMIAPRFALSQQILTVVLYLTTIFPQVISFVGRQSTSCTNYVKRNQSVIT